MASLSTLPKEILHEIISHVSPDLASLVNCSCVCRRVSEVAVEALYCSIDFGNDGFDMDLEGYADERTDERQIRFLQSIAENPRLGALVRVFKNFVDNEFKEELDVTMKPQTDASLLVSAARNMRLLSEARLLPSQLTAYIMANLPSYSRLENLTVFFLSPEDHVWRMAPTALKKLKWNFFGWEERGNTQPNPWNNIDMLINLVEATCPALESLDIWYLAGWKQKSTRLPTVSRELVNQYVQVKDRATPMPPRLQRLNHFGIRHIPTVPQHEHAIESSFLALVRRYSHTLTEIEIPTMKGPWTRRKIDHIIKVCTLLPGLKSLSLSNSNGISEDSDLINEFMQELLTFLASPKFELKRLSIQNIESPFSPEIGRLFNQLRSLEYLNVGDEDMDGGPYADDRTPLFHEYAPEILGFIKALPPSLEELFMVINGPDMACNEDKEFDPICDLRSEIFCTLRRLRSCDIHAWISSNVGGQGWLPEKGVFCRRLPHASLETDGTRVAELDHLDAWNKDLWTSRMDFIYDIAGPTADISKECLSLANIEAPFEGQDADGPWLDCYTREALELTHRGRPSDTIDYSWPFFKNKIGRYGGFRSILQ